MAGMVVFSTLVCISFAAGAAVTWNVGYRQLDLPDPLSGELFPVAVWYPTQVTPTTVFLTESLSACRLPATLCRWLAYEMQVAPDGAPVDGKFGLIVISHGAGGMALLHRDLAMKLASAGYVVAAPTHPRGSGNDISGFDVWVGRPKQLSRVIDALLEDKALGSHIEHQRVGVVGHSNGGYTALAIAGAKPDPSAPAAHCRQHPDDSGFCSFGGADKRPMGDIPNLHDPRVHAMVLMAPNAVPFSDETLARVTVPVRVYGAEFDDLTLLRYHAARLARVLPPETEYVLVSGAGHYSFVASFPAALRIVVGEGARDPDGFDRDAFHAVMNREIVDFFDRKLGKERTAADE
jgi:predicted dienelactone hydrolase